MQTVKSSFDVTPEGRLVSYRGYESNVIVPTGVTEIGERAFWGARLMTRLTLPASLRVIGAWGFAGCTSLREVASFGGVTDIGAHAFFSCTALAEVWLPPTVRRSTAVRRSGSSRSPRHSRTSEIWHFAAAAASGGCRCRQRTVCFTSGRVCCSTAAGSLCDTRRGGTRSPTPYRRGFTLLPTASFPRQPCYARSDSR